MRVRVRFSKFGSMKFLGHLDVMRYFQKAIRRTGLEVAYSEGYHPHQIMSFAQPLSLAVTSDGEYFDVEFLKEYPTEEILEKLSKAMSIEFDVTKVTRRNDYIEQTKKTTCMSLISAAAYYIEVREQAGISMEHVKALGAMETCPVTKKTKTAEKTIDLKDGIRELFLPVDSLYVPTLELQYRRDDIKTPIMDQETLVNGLLHSARNPELTSLVIVLDAGSEDNISANLVCKALAELAQVEYNPYDFRIHRMELYGVEEDEVRPLWRVHL